MKKHQIVAAVGTLALAANLLLPGLAFGQQQGTVDVGCPTPRASVSVVAPGNITFSSVSSSPTASQFDFDNALANGTALPSANVLNFADGRSSSTAINTAGVDGCPNASAGWTVTVASTNLTSGLNSIPNTSLHIVTSNATAATPAGVQAFTTGDSVFYGTATAQTGNAHNVVAPFLYDTSAKDASLNNFRNLANYQKDCTTVATGDCTGGNRTNSLDSSRTLLSATTAMNQAIATGVAIAIGSIGNTNSTTYGIAVNQANGTYTGTITYTANAL